jgi:hypothetical protein
VGEALVIEDVRDQTMLLMVQILKDTKGSLEEFESRRVVRESEVTEGEVVTVETIKMRECGWGGDRGGEVGKEGLKGMKFFDFPEEALAKRRGAS